MSFSPNRIRIAFEDNSTELLPLDTSNTEYTGQRVSIAFVVENGVTTPILTALNDVKPAYMNIEFNIPADALGEDLYYYYAAYTTNDIASVFKHSDRPKNDMKDIFVAKNTSAKINLNIGILTSHRFFTLLRLDGETVSVHYELESKLIEKGSKLSLEKFVYGTQDVFDFLENTYAPLVAKLNGARPLAEVPAGWCSWSCYYRKVNEDKIVNCVDDMTKIKGTNLFQIDDGWQIDDTFPGDWFIDKEKFPNGLDAITKKCNDNGMTFGLWLSPSLVTESSVYYDSVKHLVRTDVKAGVSSAKKTVRLFDLDNPEYYEFLYKTYHKLSYDMGVKYFKLDFLVFGYFSFSERIVFKTDYKAALFRKVITTIRQAVGDDAILLSCGSPIIECAGIFDAQRISRDIICPKNRNTDPFYWQHWSNIKNASKTVLYRYFYNNTVFRNDPDGAVLRDYDIGDGFDCTYSEAKYWSTIVAFSGGLVLANDEFRHLSQPRKELFTKLLPPLGISGHAVDMFEYPAPTKAIIEAGKNVSYIAAFNLSDNFEDITVSLKDYGIDGKKLIFSCWDAEFIGIATEINEKLVNPHNALMYMIKDIPTEPTFLYSDVNLYLGENVFSSEFVDGSLKIKINEKYEEFVTEETKVYAYYPIAYQNAIGKDRVERVVKESDDYVITEYCI